MNALSHPFFLRLDHLREIVERCDETGLHVTIDASSWHYPGQTLCVRYEVPRAGRGASASDKARESI